MLVRIIRGTVSVGRESFGPGDSVDVAPEEAVRLIAAGTAVKTVRRYTLSLAKNLVQSGKGKPE